MTIKDKGSWRACSMKVAPPYWGHTSVDADGYRAAATQFRGDPTVAVLNPIKSIILFDIWGKPGDGSEAYPVCDLQC